MCKVVALLALLSPSLYPCALQAQTTNGSITGRVTDPSKATIADAKVAAVNAGTNFRYETATNSAGEYTLANLPPGTYQLEVEKSGFKNLVRPVGGGTLSTNPESLRRSSPTVLGAPQHRPSDARLSFFSVAWSEW